MATLDGRSVVLTMVGKLAAAVILLGFTVLNVFGLRRFNETNAVVVCWKILIPLLVAVAFISTRSDPHNFVVGGFFADGLHGVLLATSSGGVIFALIGFEQAVELGGETKESQRSIPFAVIGSVIVGGGLYLLLQIAFVGVVPARYLSEGWLHVGFHGIFGPFAGLATALGLSVIAYLIYSDAIISPAGTALTYTATASRVPYAMSLEGFVPRRLSRLSTREVPLLSLGLCYVASVLIILVFPTWTELLQFVTAAVVLMYALALGVIRATGPERPRRHRSCPTPPPTVGEGADPGQRKGERMRHNSSTDRSQASRSPWAGMATTWSTPSERNASASLLISSSGVLMPSQAVRMDTVKESSGRSAFSRATMGRASSGDTLPCQPSPLLTTRARAPSDAPPTQMGMA